MTRPLPQPLAGVLFDLDGTLLDSAPDLYAALELQAAEHRVAAPPFAEVRMRVSRGARAVLRCAFADFNDEQLAALLPRYLEIYASLLDGRTRPFVGIEPLLELLERRGIAWAVVTNKPTFLAEPVLDALGWDERAAAVVCGDTLSVRKPDPAPLRYACELADLVPEQCVYVGDDLRDIEAGRAAGMHTIAAAWGYLDGGDPQTWAPDALAQQATQLAHLLGLE